MASYPLALPYLASLMGDVLGEADIRLIDENVEKVDINQTFDLALISANTLQITRAYELADALRTQSRVIIGGPHFAEYDETIFREAERHFDAVVFGKTESFWADLFHDFNSNTLARRYALRRENTPQDVIATPKFELLDLRNYLHRVIETSRGCPRHCEFCSVSGDMIFKDIVQVVEEIKYLRRTEAQQKANCSSIFFADNMMNPPGNGVERSKLLMENLIRYRESNSYNDTFSWTGQVSDEIGRDKELLNLMKRAGAQSLLIGFETLHAGLNKGGPRSPANKKKHFLETIKNIRSFGIDVIGSFIVGIENEPGTVLTDLEHFIDEASLVMVQVLIITPFPGTAIYRKYRDQSRLSYDWNKYDCLRTYP